MKVSPNSLRFVSPLTFSGEDVTASDKTRPFGGIGYSGNTIVDHWGWPDGVIFDLSTTQPAFEEIPVLWQHDTNIVVGRGKCSIGDNISIEGVIYNDADGARILGKPGHPWQMSVYIVPGRVFNVPVNTTTVVNGRTITGPCVVFYDNKVKEISVCTFGADPNTSAAVFSGGDVIDVEVREIQELSMTQEQIDALVAQVAELTASNAALTTEVTAFKQADIDRAAAVRADQIKEIFGADVSAEKAAPYMSMDATVFATVFADIRAAKPAATPAAPAQQQPVGLFTSVVTAPAAPAAGSKSPLVADAERRAAARK